MFLFVFVLALAGAYIEVRLINAWPVLGRLLDHHRDAALVFSLLVSVALGMVFGAGGVIVFGAGVVSTVLVQPYYALRRTHQLEVLRQRRQEAITRMREHRVEIQRRFQQMLAVVRLIVAIVVLPFKVLAWSADRVEWLSRKMSRHG
ncbi:MAG: hypothetical protein QOD39_3263 [Mycobacterium sp.]|jgi:hypothetical protein|nr:hypothetical protein [Mycobacterium sp.]